MAAQTAASSERKVETLADVLTRLGDIPLERVAAWPPPGTATEEDLFVPRIEKRLYELVDGVLVEKPRGWYGSLLAGVIIQLLRNYLDEHRLGMVLGPDGALRLVPGLVRVPDVSFILWERLSGDELPTDSLLGHAPDLAIEVLSRSNTRREMDRKLREYFAAGTRLAWLVDPRWRIARVYADPETFTLVKSDGYLEGSNLLPGFRLKLDDVLTRAEVGRAGVRPPSD